VSMKGMKTKTSSRMMEISIGDTSPPMVEPIHCVYYITPFTLASSEKYYTDQIRNSPRHTHLHMSIVDSGNNKQHLFRTPTYFPFGYTMHAMRTTGVHGTRTVNVGIGTAYFTTKCTDGTQKQWIVPNSIYDSNCPVNLLCFDLFHYGSHDVKTGHKIDLLEEKLTLHDKRIVPCIRDNISHLPLIETLPMTQSTAHTISPQKITMTKAHTHLHTMNEHDTPIYLHTVHYINTSSCKT